MIRQHALEPHTRCRRFAIRRAGALRVSTSISRPGAPLVTEGGASLLSSLDGYLKVTISGLRTSAAGNGGPSQPFTKMMLEKE